METGFVRIALCAGVLSLLSCGGDQSEELVLSKQFSVCMDAPRNSSSVIEKPVDVEFVDVRIGDIHATYIFDNYPRKRSVSEAMEDASPVVSDVLGVRLVARGETQAGDEYAYVKFEQPEKAKYPYAYAEIFSSDTGRKDFMDLITMMRRCRGIVR